MTDLYAMDRPPSESSPPPSKPDPKANTPAQQDRMKREADALRANLRKRKDQARLRAAAPELPDQK